MSIHNYRNILEILPESSDLVKSASVSDGLPTDSEASTLMSALQVVYMTKIANQAVEEADIKRVSLATTLYGLMDKVAELSQLMISRSHEKQASSGIDVETQVRIAESEVEVATTGLHKDIEKIASASQELYDGYGDMVESKVVRRYACGDYLCKSAAVDALEARHYLAPKTGFDKLAQIISASDELRFSKDELRQIAGCVTELDKRAGLNARGFDFYKEAFITKQAMCSSLKVTLDKVPVPVENIMKAPIADILGADVASEIGNDPVNAKYVVEALPMDAQRLLLQRVR